MTGRARRTTLINATSRPADAIQDRVSLPAGLCGTAARLVGFGFRGWLSGLRSAELGELDRVWTHYRELLGDAQARTTVGALANWVASVQRSSSRSIAVCAPDCEQFCRDECMAISMIAAAQNDTCPAMRACAFALIGGSNVDGVVSGAEAFAGALRESGQVLTPEMIHNAASDATPVNRAVA